MRTTCDGLILCRALWANQGRTGHSPEICYLLNITSMCYQCLWDIRMVTAEADREEDWDQLQTQKTEGKGLFIFSMHEGQVKFLFV